MKTNGLQEEYESLREVRYNRSLSANLLHCYSPFI